MPSTSRRIALAALALACAAAVAGCQRQTVAGAAEAWKGIYAIQTYTVNAAGCDGEGPSALDSLRDRFVLVFPATTMGQPRLGIMSCRDLDECRDKARRQAAGEMLSGEFGYELVEIGADGRLSARYASTGFGSPDHKTCTGGSASDRALERAAGVLRLEERTRRARDYPADDEGACWTDRALAAAEGEPCSQLTVLTASLVP